MSKKISNNKIDSFNKSLFNEMKSLFSDMREDLNK